jgi:hypothetical protein
VKVSRHSSDHVSVDTVVSALHHRFTSAILLVCCALVTSRQYFGEPILCIQDSSDDDEAIPSRVLNTYCFVTSTYTVVRPTGKACTYSIIRSLSIILIKMNSVALSLQANYTDSVTATYQRNLMPTSVDRGVSCGQRGGSPTVVILSFLDRSGYFSFK